MYNGIINHNPPLSEVRKTMRIARPNPPPAPPAVAQDARQMRIEGYRRQIEAEMEAEIAELKAQVAELRAEADRPKTESSQDAEANPKGEIVVYNKTNAAEALGLSVKTIDRQICLGAIPHRKVGDRVIFTKGDLLSFLDSCLVRASGPPSGREIRMMAKRAEGDSRETAAQNN